MSEPEKPLPDPDSKQKNPSGHVYQKKKKEKKKRLASLNDLPTNRVTAKILQTLTADSVMCTI
jgi:hypothetical protein